MLLTFKERFVAPIIAGEKIHTIRKDPAGRWKPGRRISFWKGSPRNPQKKPFRFGTGVVWAVDHIKIFADKNEIHLRDFVGTTIIKDRSDLDGIAKNDGFLGWEEMRKFFSDDFKGVVIYWKDFKPIGQPANH